MPLSAPTKIEIPFATSGSKNTIPVPSQIGVTPGLASYTDGFPPLTMTPLASGGVPPFGQDFNGVLYEITNAMQWQQVMAGAYAYDSAFATAVGGYPLGAAVLRSDGLGLWINQTANNSTDPEAGGAGWVPLMQPGNTAITMTNANVTLTPLQAGKEIITITGTLTGNLNLIFPAYVKNWIIVNNTTGAFSITAKTAAGTGVVVAQGVATQIYGEGTNIYSIDSIQFASNAEAQGLTVANKVISPATLDAALKGANQSLANNGYQLLPGGLIIQWGQSGQLSDDAFISVSLPITFPTNCFSIVANFTESSINPNGMWVPVVKWSAGSISSFSLGADDVGASTMGTMSAYFIAIGY